jgi:hypothetical protein
MKFLISEEVSNMNIFLEVVAGEDIREFFLGELFVFCSELISVTTFRVIF